MGVAAGASTGLLALTTRMWSNWKGKRNERHWNNILYGEREAVSSFVAPSRKAVQEQARQLNYDVLVIGGGATGVGCSLEAAVKGLRVLCLEKGDWAAETSSKSTKLIHGGVRYLEKAFKNLDYAQWEMVKESLKERSVLLRSAPFIATELPIMLPVYSWFKVPYYWLGSKVYDLLAGSQSLSSSFFIGKSASLKEIPTLKSEGLCGSIMYFDGQQNDARMNITLALTAAFHGAHMLNYHNVVQLVKDTETGKLAGALVEDVETGERFHVQAKCIFNATGPFCDSIRQMDNQSVQKTISASEGTHIVLPMKFGSPRLGLLVPSTEDGRVLFMLPWNGHLVVGTTDNAIEVQESPVPTQRGINYILNELGKRLDSSEVEVQKSDILASWTGIRPLVKVESAGSDTQSLVRSHYIEQSSSGLVIITGGKWTTYRKMAEDTIAFVGEKFGFALSNGRSTEFVPLLGTHSWKKDLHERLVEEFGISDDVALHLSESYGDRARKVLEYATHQKDSEKHSKHSASDSTHKMEKIHPDFPYLKAEILFSIRNEYAVTCIDILARRTRISFLNCKAALQALPQIIAIMARELDWKPERRAHELENAIQFLDSMGFSLTRAFETAASGSQSEVSQVEKHLPFDATFPTAKVASS